MEVANLVRQGLDDKLISDLFSTTKKTARPRAKHLQKAGRSQNRQAGGAPQSIG